jgi:hypothetical protein
MEKANEKRFPAVLAAAFLGIVLAAAVSLAPAATGRTFRTLGEAIGGTREAALEKRAREAKERWRLTGPGTVLPRGLVSGTEE